MILTPEELYSLVIKKKELSKVSKELVLKVINQIILSKKLSLKALSPKDSKIIVKLVREQLRDYVGRFQFNSRERENLLSSKNWELLLDTHSSTKERVSIYPEVIKLIYLSNPSSILDLGCGLNPLAVAKPGVKYYASDVNLSDLEVVEEYFKEKGINGETFPLDLTSDSISLPKSEITLMFKLLDFLEKKKKGLSEHLLKSIPSKLILVSFSNIKLSGKRMNSPKRIWFERMCSRLNLSFETKEFHSEIFYLIKK